MQQQVTLRVHYLIQDASGAGEAYASYLGVVCGVVEPVQWWGSADGKRGARWGGGERATEAGGITGRESGSETFRAWVLRPTKHLYIYGLRKRTRTPLLPGTVMEIWEQPGLQILRRSSKIKVSCGDRNESQNPSLTPVRSFAEE